MVVPITRSLAWRRVVVVSHKRRWDVGRQRAAHLVEGTEELANGSPQLGDDVFGGHGVEDGGRVEDPSPALHRPGMVGHHLGVLGEAMRVRGTAQPFALTDESARLEGLGARVDPLAAC